MKYGGKAKGKVAAYKAMLRRPGFWQAVERSTAWLGPCAIPVQIQAKCGLNGSVGTPLRP